MKCALTQHECRPPLPQTATSASSCFDTCMNTLRYIVTVTVTVMFDAPLSVSRWQRAVLERTFTMWGSQMSFSSPPPPPPPPPLRSRRAEAEALARGQPPPSYQRPSIEVSRSTPTEPPPERRLPSASFAMFQVPEGQRSQSRDAPHIAMTETSSAPFIITHYQNAMRSSADAISTGCAHISGFSQSSCTRDPTQQNHAAEESKARENRRSKYLFEASPQRAPEWIFIPCTPKPGPQSFESRSTPSSPHLPTSPSHRAFNVNKASIGEGSFVITGELEHGIMGKTW